MTVQIVLHDTYVHMTNTATTDAHPTASAVSHWMKCNTMSCMSTSQIADMRHGTCLRHDTRVHLAGDHYTV